MRESFWKKNENLEVKRKEGQNMCEMTFEISFTWALVVGFISTLVFIYKLCKK